MFMQRLITTLILVPLILGTILYASPWILGGILLILLMALSYEYSQLIPLKSHVAKTGYLISIYLALILCHYLFAFELLLAIGIWCMLCIAIVTFPSSQKYWGHPWVVGGLGMILLPVFIECLVHLYYLDSGSSLLIYFLFLIWAADIGAYLTGNLGGKHKLIPKVSPGKSWEGLAGGYGLAAVIALIGWFYFKSFPLGFWIVLNFLTISISVFGDLFISMLKRRCHLKDTGSLIPGHGGFLDRLDSLMAALPLFYVGLSLLR